MIRKRWLLPLLLLAAMLPFTIGAKACSHSPETVQQKTANAAAQVGDGIDAAQKIVASSYDHGKIGKDRSIAASETLKVANQLVKRADQRILTWVNQVASQRQAVLAAGQVWVDPPLPDEVKADVRTILDQIKATLADLGDITDNALVKQIAQVVTLVESFYELLR